MEDMSMGTRTGQHDMEEAELPNRIWKMGTNICFFWKKSAHKRICAEGKQKGSCYIRWYEKI